MTRPASSPLIVACPECGADVGQLCRDFTRPGRHLTRGVHPNRRRLRHDQLYREESGRPAVVHLDSWAGRSSVRVTVLAETPKSYRVRYEEGALSRQQGDVALVPKYAITFTQDPP